MLIAAIFTVLLEGEPVADTEVCVAPGRGFATQTFTCATGDVALPAGEWTAFARRGRDLISDAVVTNAQELRLVRATRADVAAWPVAPNESRFVYVPRTRSALPVLETVPADTLAIPVTVQNGRVVSVGEATSDGRLRVTKSPSVVVPVTIERAPLGKSQPPLVTLTDAAGKVHKPVAPIASSAAGTELVFFRGVSGGLTAKVEGERWKTASGPADKPLTTTATSKLAVNWWLANDPSVLAREVPECTVKSDFDRSQPGKRFHFILAQCVRGNCSTVAERELPHDQARGVIELEGIPAGRYRMEIEYPNLPPVWKVVEVAADEVTRTDFEARWFTFFGKVTRGAKPAHVRVFGTVSDPESGEYHAILSRGPERNGLDFLVPCDGGRQFNFVYDDPPAENTRFDIEIPSNRVPVSVFDAATGTPVAQARVTLTALQEGSDSAAHFAGIGHNSDDQGHADLGPVLTNRRLIVCADHADYLRKCTDPFRMKGIDEKAIRLDLQKADKRAGRVIVNGEIQAGGVTFFGADGTMGERLFVKPDGTFTMQRPHAAGELVAFVSRSHPLYVFALQRPVGETLDIRVPDGPLRSFDVIRAGTATEVGFFTFAMGDLIVPMQVVSDYIARRGAQPALTPGATAPVRDVVQTGPISVIFVPVTYLKDRMSGGRDPVLGFPEGRSLPRQPLGDRPSVTIE
jgi:hypothetical protein